MAPTLVTGRGSTFTSAFNIRDTLAQRDTFMSPVPTSVLDLHTLEARPFNHLGVWAYLAFGFIVLALTTVLAYVLYSCYHSAKGRMDAELVAAGTADNGEENMSYSDGGKINLGRPNGIDVMGFVNHSVGGVGEKVKMGGAGFGKTTLEMKGFGVNGHRWIPSESERNIITLPYNSQTSLSNFSDTSLDTDAHYLASPPLVHNPKSTEAYIPFHLPPPPLSPTPAHKKNLERQYRGRVHHSPGSPSPSFSISLSPPPTSITPRVRSPAVRSDAATWSGNTTIGSDYSDLKVQFTGNADGSRDQEPSAQFDSNNIRFVSPLNPFISPSAAMLWNDPKLSPIHGSIITTPNTVGDTTFVEESSFVKAVTAPLRTPPKRTTRLMPLTPEADTRSADKESTTLSPRKARKHDQGQDRVATPPRSTPASGHNVFVS